jgi:hypothetical protein
MQATQYDQLHKVQNEYACDRYEIHAARDYAEERGDATGNVR